MSDENNNCRDMRENGGELTHDAVIVGWSRTGIIETWIVR